MSEHDDNNNSGGFPQRFKGWFEVGTAAIAFISALVGLRKLIQGETGLWTQVFIIFGIVILFVLCGYTYFYWKPNKIWRRVALAGMFAVPILSIAGVYTWQHLPPKNIIVLLADFEASSEKKSYGVTQNIFEQMEEATQKYSDVKILLLNRVITEKKEALKEGENHKSTIVIWGQYRVTATTVQLTPHFEVLRPPKYLPQFGRLGQTAAISELNSFKLQTNLSKEMVYLSLFTVGLTRYTASNWDLAITSFNDALGQVKDPIKELDQSIVYNYRGNAYNYKKDYDRAIADYNQALKLDPNYAKAYNNRGLAYNYKKDYDRAIADYNQALKLDPNYAKAYNNRGLAYYHKKDYDRAIVDYNQALKLDPNLAIAYNYRGNAYNYKKDYDRAIADYNQALKLDPNLANAYISRGYTYVHKEDYQHAFADFNKAVQLDPKNANTYDSRCEAYRTKGDNDRAIADCNQSIKLDPTFTNSYYNRGLAYRNKGSKDKAVQDFLKVLELNDRVELSQKAKQQLQELDTVTTVQPGR